MELALSPGNWSAALCAVERNGGAPGPDGMKAKELRSHLSIHGEMIKQRLLEGRYVASAAKRRDIPKASGGTRPLSIPDVQDRFVQQLLLGVLQPLFEPRFSAHSYGFRPGRSAHEAVQATQRFAREGFTHVVDMDITKFFDRVNHDILMSRMGEVVKDKRVLRVIGSFLRAGVVLPEGMVVRNEEGTPQGGPISPLLANIYLDALDKELERRGLRFARYADDCNIYVSSAFAAERILGSISQWIARHLRLEVSVSKSGTGRPWERKFLGFVITSALLIGISGASLERFENRVRELWEVGPSRTTVQLRDQWKRYVQGWWGYYGLVEDRRPIFWKEAWIRRHIRKCFWQRWHTSTGRYKALRRLGIPPKRARIGRSTRGAWRMAKNPVMHEALSNRRLRAYGFVVPSDLGS
jgi:RNA-directed DNA polymerase